MKDTHPVEPTTEWYYQTAKTFPRDGKPVYIQVGSSENGAHIVYSIIAGNKLLEKGSLGVGRQHRDSAFHLQGGICVGHRTEL